MTLSTKTCLATAALAMAAVAPAHAHDTNQSGKTVVEVAVDDGQFDALVAAVLAADLDGTLSGDGPFTVFAPTNSAFNALPASELIAVTDNTDHLQSLLTYHVVSGRIMSSDLSNGQRVETLEGGKLRISTKNGPMIGDANIIAADIEASNGVVHVIDSVLFKDSWKDDWFDED